MEIKPVFRNPLTSSSTFYGQTVWGLEVGGLMTLSLMQMVSVRLGYLSDAQNLLAGDLANIDTPGYQPAGVIPFSDYLNNTGAQVPMLRDDPDDLPGVADASPVANPVSAPPEHSLDGNAVSLDQQLVAISKNSTDQEFTANLYQTYMGMFKTALGTS
jgi:flagellar basal-body rod protein FlgB